MVTDRDLKKAAKAAKLSIFLILFGVIFMLGSLFYAAQKIKNLNDEIANLTKARSKLHDEIKQENSLKANLENKINNLKETQQSIFDFLATITRANKVGFIDPDVNWQKVQEQLIYMKPGKRKEAVLGAIIMSSVGITFRLGQRSVHSGFDSSTFIEYVLSQVGVKIIRHPTKYLSQAIMEQFIKVSNPRPGDLLFYKGQVGNFGLFYLGPGKPAGHGVAIGALGSSVPCVIVDTQSDENYPFLGYFHVNYPDE